MAIVEKVSVVTYLSVLPQFHSCECSEKNTYLPTSMLTALFYVNLD